MIVFLGGVEVRLLASTTRALVEKIYFSQFFDEKKPSTGFHKFFNDFSQRDSVTLRAYQPSRIPKLEKEYRVSRREVDGERVEAIPKRLTSIR